jgi:hypothetical protein
MTDQIKLQLDFVNDLRFRLVQAVGSFAEVLYLKNQVTGSPRTSDALGDFHGRWDLRRGELSSALEGLQVGITAIRDEMVKLDTQLAASVTKAES